MTRFSFAFGDSWLALPFGDSRKAFLSRKFKVNGLVAIGPSGRTVTKEAKDLVMLHGAEAYPFTVDRIKEIEAKYDEMAKGWPEKVKHATHEHDLVLSRRKNYLCNGCNEVGRLWLYQCDECDFDLHPKCALELEDKGNKDDATKEENSKDDAKEEENSKDGRISDGEVCTKA